MWDRPAVVDVVGVGAEPVRSGGCGLVGLGDGRVWSGEVECL